MADLIAEEYRTFERIKRTDECGVESWFARDLQDVLQYTQWRNFQKVIDRAMIACKNSGFEVTEHFAEVSKTIKMPKNAEKLVVDYQLTRYACYLIVQNGDPRKEIIALGQTYFAIQTRRSEVADAFNHARKNLKEKEKILDFMGSTELIANLFRISQAEEKLKTDKASNPTEANNIHYEVAEKIRNAMIEMGTTLPENLPTPEKSIQTIEREEIRKLRNSAKPLMLDE